MQVVHALAGVGADVGHQPPARPVDPLGSSEVRGCRQDLDDHPGVFVADGGGRVDVFLRDEQDVNGSLGVQVPKRQDVVGGMHDIGIDLLGDDLAENAVAGPAQLLH